MNIPMLRQALKAGWLRELDVYFAERVSRGATENRDNVALAAALVSHAVGQGNVCLNLAREAGRLVFATENIDGVCTPTLAAWKRQLQQSTVIGTPGEVKPLILDGDNLYLGRYWQFEQELATRLIDMAISPASHLDIDLLQNGLVRLFPLSTETDWQRVAAALAVLRSLLIVSGGPGTGKTHTVTAILALLIEQAQKSGKTLRIALAAPTGKAAARLTESTGKAKSILDTPERVKEAIPCEAITLHRLLGVRSDSVTPRYNTHNPLHLDVLVVDEASMIDLPLMSRLLAALPYNARLIVLGDKDQLASVEAGSVFADLCGGNAHPEYSTEMTQQLLAMGCRIGPAKADPAASQSSSPEEQIMSPVELSDSKPTSLLAGNVAVLYKSYRFDEYSGIGHLARAVNEGDIQAVHSILSGNYQDIAWHSWSGETLVRSLREYALAAFTPVMQAASPEQALDALEAIRILCAVRQGPTGVEQVNQVVQQVLTDAGHIQGRGEFYAGRPIMVNRNNYRLGLFNGDIGILWPDPDAGGALRAWFRLADRSMYSLIPGRLPNHETAFALTVHKSQGSEFSRVLLLLPEVSSQVVTRELIYTGVTRASRTVEIWGARSILEQGVQCKVARTSGLLRRIGGEV